MMLGNILDCFSNLYFEAGSLSQMQSSPIQPLLLSALLWGNLLFMSSKAEIADKTLLTRHLGGF